MAGKRLTAEAVERIISATRLDGFDDSRIDRERLAKDLELNRDLCGGGAVLKPAFAKRDKANLEGLAKSARKFDSNGEYLPPEVKSALKALIVKTDWALQKLSHPADKYRNVFKNRSTFELLVGFGLSPIYHDHFQDDVGISRGTARKPEGPFIRFAEQALIELDFKHNGKPYSRESIARALTLAKSSQVRNHAG
jgi:hypothetical protein